MIVAVSGSGSIVNWGDAAVTSVGGQYRLCWCAGLHSPLALAGHAMKSQSAEVASGWAGAGVGIGILGFCLIHKTYNI